MESKKIEIKEAVDVRDAIPGMAAPAPVKGMIRLYDKDGNLVREVHNTIVQTGREFLFHRFLGSNTMETGKTISSYATATLKNDRSSDKFGYLHFGFATTPQMTTQDLDYGSVIGNDLYSGNKKYPITNVTFDQSALKVTISQSVSSANGLMKFNEIFITTVSSDGTTETLFSRALIDPLYIGEDTVYDMSYSFYF